MGLEMETENSVYHVSNATLGNKVTEGRTTVYVKAKGKTAAICNLVNSTLENASLDFIVTRSMNASFSTKGPNVVTVSGYVQPLVELSDSETQSSAARAKASQENSQAKELEGKVKTRAEQPKLNAKDEEVNRVMKEVESKTDEESKTSIAGKVNRKNSIELEIKGKSTTAVGDTKSKKRKLKEVEDVIVADNSEKSNKNKRKKENGTSEKDTLVSKTNSSGDSMEVEEVPVIESADVEMESKEAKEVCASQTKVPEEHIDEDKVPVNKPANIEIESKKAEKVSANQTKIPGEPMELEKVCQTNPAKEESKSEKVEDEASVSKTTCLGGHTEKSPSEGSDDQQPKKAFQDDSEGSKVEANSNQSPEEAGEEQKKDADPKGSKETKVKESSTKKSSSKSKSSKKSKKKSKKLIDAGKGVTYRVLKKGNAGVKPAKKGDSITLLYVGCLKDGTQFDINLKDGLTFKIGGGEVIPGIELGVLGMSPKEKRRITIPPEQGYGADGASEGKIPPNAVLEFTVQRK